MSDSAVPPVSGAIAIFAEVLRHGLQAVAEEMGAALIRTAYSINIRDRRDFSCAVFDAAGRLIAQAEHIPVHLGLMGGLIARCRAATGGDLPPGGMWVVNDPWISGSHLPDIVLIAAADIEDGRIGYVANMAHHVDVGGLAPGSLALGVTEITQEGLRLPPTVLVRNGDVDPNILRIIAAASRLPEMVIGDLMAQVAANKTGLRRLGELAGRAGRARFDNAVGFLLAATARRVEDRLRMLEGRAAAFEDTLEWQDGERPDDLVIRVALSVADGRLRADFNGSAPQVAGPVNATPLVTASCLLYAVKSYLDPHIGSNDGLFERLDLVLPEASLVAAAPPMPVALCTSIASQRICDVLIGAFNRLMPDQAMAASSGSMNALIIGGDDVRTGRRFSYVETYAGGQGATSGLDGADAVHTHMTNTANSPVEMMERDYPFDVLGYGLAEGTGGAGQYRGGHGVVRTLRLLSDATVTTHLDRTRTDPWGIQAGGAGGRSVVTVERNGERRSLAGKSTQHLRAGDILEIRTAGGGGCGDAARRDARAAERDTACGLGFRTA
ncbi:hydantoinase B/oxoprolinase family protein [Acetobacteraceae bacterium KSS8]|uniref:Hydantoinase B/oxoprolinase family protein n=1 Tax=Endosaccharibacter trunci TaxID=2812733 RepID=A0ABT1W6P2_9PROT|nr:hydantoinase B/oxoprolinase family protein [Acetobacteraceae bacterium KSS8]